jgi:phage tail sheath gpL-like
MGTLALALSGVALYPNPGQYLEVQFAKGEMLGNPGTPSVLLIGRKMAASGTATADTQVCQLTSHEDAIGYFGARSNTARCMRRFADVCKGALVYGIAATESAGNPSAAGAITLTVSGETIVVPFASGEAFDTVVAEALNVAINNQPNWGCTATRLAGVVTLLYASKGTDGNMMRVRVSITAGVGTTCVAATEVPVNGLTDETWTALLATTLASDYDFIVPLTNWSAAGSDARIAALKTQVVAQALPSTGIRQQVIMATGGTAADAVTFVALTAGCQNNPRFQCWHMKAPEWEPCEIAAHMAAVRYNKEKCGNPWYNYNGYGKGVNDVWNIPAPYAHANWTSSANITTLIAGGVSPIAETAAGNTYAVKSCTCSTDIRVRDTNKVSVADSFADDLAVRYASQWAGASLQDDPLNDNDQPPPTSLTPSRLKGLTIAPLYLLYSDSDHGWLESEKTRNKVTGDIVACQTGIDPVNVTRINAKCPLHVVPCADVFACLITENSAA